MKKDINDLGFFTLFVLAWLGVIFIGLILFEPGMIKSNKEYSNVEG